jgi:predicted O-methyltransferase YrrM
MLAAGCVAWVAAFCVSANPDATVSDADSVHIQAVIDQVEKACLQRTVYMLGRKKAERLAELVRQAKPKVVVECGTAIGYSGLWIARELKRAGGGHLITIEIQPSVAKEAEENFRKAGLADFVSVKVGDARKVVQTIDETVDFLLIDCNAANYHGCFVGLERRLREGAVVVADNVGISESGMADYLKLVRGKYQSRIEWFDPLDVPWAKRDAMEITIIRPKALQDSPNQPNNERGE